MANPTGSTDANAVLTRALSEADRRDENGRSMLGEFAATAHAVQWLQVLAIPRLFESMKRKPDRTHLLMMVDIFRAYVDSGKQYSTPEFNNVPYERRAPLALKLRGLIEAWPTTDIVQMATVARELLYCDGIVGPEGGWDNAPDPDIPPDEYLLQPEDAGDFAVYAEQFATSQ